MLYPSHGGFGFHANLPQLGQRTATDRYGVRRNPFRVSRRIVVMASDWRERGKRNHERR